MLPPFDLTTGGRLFTFNGHTDVKEFSVYVRDAITKGNWSLNLGLRGDFYNGLTAHNEGEPRVGVAYNIKRRTPCFACPMLDCWKPRSTKIWCSPASDVRMLC